ncbi:uncharacterized protein KD926_009730 [Aspergillus affinis]|uniref:uncharacterized protein n=1 Tax=Aspergillus affinis TaxID=1070780 RepID=UPI0022FE93C9|nr:uncharacterized protein KD926_009730 [Aspergillus affinis]KAI9039288.1 hypothetical protein KD926_009730 [Aspergillus affinis]
METALESPQANGANQEEGVFETQVMPLLRRIADDVDIMRENGYSEAEIMGIITRITQTIDTVLGSNDGRGDGPMSQTIDIALGEDNSLGDTASEEDDDFPEDEYPEISTTTITHHITEENEVILENTTPGNLQSVIEYLSQLNVVHSFLEYNDEPNKLIVRWVIIRHREFYFIDGATMAKFLRALNEQGESSFTLQLEQYAINVRDRPEYRELDYEAGRFLYAILHWKIIDAANLWEADRRHMHLFNTVLLWLPAMRTIVDTMGDRYREEDPLMEERLGGFHDAFLYLLKDRFLVNLSVFDPDCRLLSVLPRQQHLDFVAWFNSISMHRWPSR